MNADPNPQPCLRQGLIISVLVTLCFMMFSELDMLSLLDLGDNQLVQLPGSLGYLVHLQTLNLRQTEQQQQFPTSHFIQTFCQFCLTITQPIRLLKGGKRVGQPAGLGSSPSGVHLENNSPNLAQPLFQKASNQLNGQQMARYVPNAANISPTVTPSSSIFSRFTPS